MIAALAYEWLRIRTIRSTWWVTAIAVTLAIGISFLIAFGVSQAFRTSNPPSGRDLDILAQVVVSQASAYGELGAPFLLPYVLGMLGVFTWGHEYRHGMVRATLTTVPNRMTIWLAKYLMTGAWVAAVVLATLSVCAASGWLWLRDDGVSFATYALLGTIVKCATYTVLFTWVAMAVTSILRSQTGAIVIMLVWPLVIENIAQVVFALVPPLRDAGDALRFLPFEAGKAMLSGLDVTVGLFGDPLTPWAGFIVFSAYAVALMAASYVLFHKRDA